MTESKGREIAYVREENAPLEPPPLTHIGLLGWLYRNFFASMSNFSTSAAAARSLCVLLLTLLTLWIAAPLLWRLLSFGLFDAVWIAPSGLKGEVCRTVDHPDGGVQPTGWFAACYPYVSAKWAELVYGRFPAQEIWRANAVFLLGGLGLAQLIAHTIPQRRVMGFIFVVFGVLFALWAAEFLGEPLGQRVGAQLMIGIGAIWVLTPLRPPGRMIGFFILLAYPTISFILLTGGDIAIAPQRIGGLAAIGAALILLSPLIASRALGDATAAFAGAARLAGWLALAAALALFLSSSLLVDVLEAAAGHGMTTREAAALEWWAQNAPAGRSAPTPAEIAAFGQVYGSSLAEEELARLADLGWDASPVGAATAPGGRAVWPLPPVATADWGGLLATVVVSFAGVAFAFPFAVLLAIGRNSRLPVVRWLCSGFIEMWRAIPLASALFLLVALLPFLQPGAADLNSFLRAILAVFLVSSAALAEVVRGGLATVSRGQLEAGAALGLRYGATLQRIVLPQTLALALPGVANTFTVLFKDTTLVLIIGVTDVLGMVNLTLEDREWASPSTALTGYLVVGLIFFLFCYGVNRYARAVERQLRRG